VCLHSQAIIPLQGMQCLLVSCRVSDEDVFLKARWGGCLPQNAFSEGFYTPSFRLAH